MLCFKLVNGEERVEPVTAIGLLSFRWEYFFFFFLFFYFIFIIVRNVVVVAI